MYSMTHTRPDLAYACSVLSRAMASPSPVHMIAIKRVLRYVKQTVNWSLRKTKEQKNEGIVTRYTD